jgi:hypothetical protein
MTTTAASTDFNATDACMKERGGLACAPPPPTNNAHTNTNYDVALVNGAHNFEAVATEESNGASLPRRFTFGRVRDIEGKTSLIAGQKYFGFGGAAASSTAFGRRSTTTMAASSNFNITDACKKKG